MATVGFSAVKKIETQLAIGAGFSESWCIDLNKYYVSIKIIIINCK